MLTPCKAAWTIAFCSACVVRRQLSVMLPSSLMLFLIKQPTSVQCGRPAGEPLYPVVRILLFFVMMAPTSSLLQVPLFAIVNARLTKYSSQLGRLSAIVFSSIEQNKKLHFLKHMMQEHRLLAIALIWSVAGLMILLLLAIYAEPQQLQIAGLETEIGKIVAVTAEVESVSYKEDTVFMTLSDNTGKIKTVFFGNPSSEIIRGDSVAVKGKIQLYRGNLEIVIQELRCLSC